jgi:hypothetical protein
MEWLLPRAGGLCLLIIALIRLYRRTPTERND